MHNDENSSANSGRNLPPSPTPTSERAKREARVAAALRENLLKRKQQARARAGESSAVVSDSSTEQG